MADELIYEKISAIMKDIGAIGKEERNVKQGYQFRGIDTIYNELHDILTKHKVFTVPQVMEQSYTERTSQSGNLLMHRSFTMKYIFYAEDGSSIEVIVPCEGMDSGDKASNKAISAAHKYAFIQLFSIPTKEEKDADSDSHEVKAEKT
jgi:hypothetical protein